MPADVEFFFDPVCPFCWVTSRWVRQVQGLREGLDVAWRFISLQMLNEDQGYEDKPERYPEVHHKGLRLLRVAAAVRDAHGEDAVGPLYATIGHHLWEVPLDNVDEDGFEAILEHHAGPTPIAPILEEAGLPPGLADAADDPQWDATIRRDTEEALERAGGDVGTPILSFSPPDGPAFFGPVISHEPSDEDALRCWDAVVTLAHWPGFAELKRGLRQFPVTELTAAIAGQETDVS